MIETITLQSNNLKLVGILSGHRDWPIAILIHGLISNKNSDTYIALEKELNEHQIATFRIDLFGHGESDGKIEELTITKCIQNTNDALDFAQKRGYTKIGIVGSSLSGYSNTIVASKRNDLSAMALKCPLFDYVDPLCNQLTNEDIAEWKTKRIRKIHSTVDISLRYDYYEDFKHYNTYEAATTTTIPVLLVHGNQDRLVPIAQSMKAAKQFPNATLKIIDGADHGFETEEQWTEMKNSIKEFLISHLL